MVVTPELRAQILRLYLANQWRIGTIARQLHLHRDTVRRVLAVSNVLCAPAAMPPRLIDPFMPFIQETLAKFPTLAASRLYAMVQERGYGGGSSHFRHLVAPLRPGLQPRPTCDCAPWPVNKPRWTGLIWAM